MAYWEIDFSVFAPVTFNGHISFEAEKGTTLFSFYSKIHLSNKPFGFNATVTAYAHSKEDAQIAGRVFFESMLNILSFKLNETMVIYEDNIKLKTPNYSERLIIKKEDFEKAFKLARYFEIEEPTLAKSLSWYSKAINSYNVIDEFLYLYNVMEILGKGYAERNEFTSGDTTKNKIVQIFKDFKNINVNEFYNWVNEMANVRNEIAHGFETINYEKIVSISKLIPVLKANARTILEKILDAKCSEIEI
jgi:hypothetical protein